MENIFFNDFVMASRLKDAKRKKRLVKKDFEKQLLKLDKKSTEIWKAIRELPLVPIENPYQKGWKRFFVVREDVLKSKEGEFFENLLLKINTFQYSNQKKFTERKRRNQKKVDAPKEQKLLDLFPRELNCEKLNLSDKEKKYFEQVEKWCAINKNFRTVFQFTESWRYVLKIKPNIITHKQSIDSDLESQYNRLENYITNKDLRRKINKIKGIEGYYNYDYLKVKNKNPLKQKNLKTIYEMFLNEKI